MEADELDDAVDDDVLPAPPPPTLVELVELVELVDDALELDAWVLDADVVDPEPVDDPVGGSSTPAAQDIVAIESRSATVLRMRSNILDQRK